MSGERRGDPTGMTETKAPNVCFGCGEANPDGMQLPFTRDHEHRRVIGRFRLEKKYQGAPGMAHGGIVALVLDEALSKVARFYEARAVTAELHIEYLKPVRVGEEIHVEAHQERAEGRNLFHVGEIRDGSGRVLARARGRFVVVDPEKFRQRNGVNLG
jgi:uncharacterized protein (TIGR00369 family)